MAELDAERYQVLFRPAKFETTKFVYIKPSVNLEEIENTFNFQVAVNISDQLNTIRLFNVTQLILKTDPVTKVIHHESLFDFFVSGLDQIPRAENDAVRFPHRFLFTLIAFTISTIRGVLIEKTAGTPLSTVIIPGINVAEMIGPPDEEGFANVSAVGGQRTLFDQTS